MGPVAAYTKIEVETMEPRSVYNSPKMATMMTRRETEEMWYPVPINAENNIGCDAGRKTSPWT